MENGQTDPKKLMPLSEKNEGLSDLLNTPLLSADPDDYALFTDEVKALGGSIQSVYENALASKQAEEQASDDHYFLKKNGLQDLQKQISSSLKQLDSLNNFLTDFQQGLSDVSGHLNDLQSRNRDIETRLKSHKDIESTLDSFLSQITISPALIHTISDTSPSDNWLSAISELESRLTSIRTGPRVASRKNLDDVAENLRLKASKELREFFIAQLHPYGVSITPNLHMFQNSVLMKYRPFFYFLQRHAAKNAHEVQKVYINTARWYYETGFRRYVRALDNAKIIPSALSVDDHHAEALPNDTLNFSPTREEIMSGIEYASSKDDDVTLAFQTSDKNYFRTVEALFKSMSLVLMDNASNEWNFISSFFAPLETAESSSQMLHPSSQDGNQSFSSDYTPSEYGGDDADTHSDAYSTAILGSDAQSTSAAISRRKKGRKFILTQNVWKQIMGPCLEYAKNYCISLINNHENFISPVSILTMIRLNEALFKEAVIDCVCPASLMESHLISLRLHLWPIFQKQLNAQADLAISPKGLSSIFGQRITSDGVLRLFARRYIFLFCKIVALCEDQDEEMVFSRLLRLRSELHNQIDTHSSKLPSGPKKSAFLSAFYDEILKGLTAGSTSHSRSQSEISHWREIRRKIT